MTFEIQPMRIHHLAAVTDLEKLVFSHPWTSEDFMAEQSIPDAICLVLTAAPQDHSLAYLCCRTVSDGIEILKIAVHPEHQRKGLAAFLLTALNSRKKESQPSGIFLEVACTNAAALAFYRKQGFKQTGIRKRYYPGSIDALNMMKPL